MEDAIAVVVQAVCQGATSAITRGTDEAVTTGYRRLLELLFHRGGSAHEELAARQQQLDAAVRALADSLADLDERLTAEEVQAAADVIHTDARLLQSIQIDSSAGIVGSAVGSTITMNFDDKLPRRRK